MKHLSLILSLLLMSGCATIMSGSRNDVTITSTPAKADFIITNKAGTQIASGTTPATLKLDTSDGYFSAEEYRVFYNKKGYHAAESFVDSHLNGWYAGNLVCGIIIGGLIVDPLTGSMWKLDHFTNGTLDKHKN